MKQVHLCETCNCMHDLNLIDETLRNEIRFRQQMLCDRMLATFRTEPV